MPAVAAVGALVQARPPTQQDDIRLCSNARGCFRFRVTFKEVIRICAGHRAGELSSSG